MKSTHKIIEFDEYEKVAIHTYRIDSAESWKTHQTFYFNYVDKVEIFGCNEFGNQPAIVHSKDYPFITYPDGYSYRRRRATEEDLKPYCQITDNKFYFPQVKKNWGVDIGRDVWD